ncbi:MAG: prepilin-type N-terminal cleavage/methylation domain-containing protein [Desulfuromonadaceae bacterium]|nr:prepilin-type N-terminal cleavage/methylation domain-containing protein [Desulfuromonadaceae bacterium]
MIRRNEIKTTPSPLKGEGWGEGEIVRIDSPLPSIPSRQGRGRLLAESGFTLIEMIVVIVIVGILAALGGQFIVAPVTGYIDLSRRARLVDQAEMALRRMQRDIRHALPNSIRIDNTGQYLEMLNTVDGGRYRRYQDPVPGGDILDFTVAETGFDVLGDLRVVPTSGQSLVVYNISSSGSSGNAYAAAPDNMAVIGAGSTVAHVNLSPGFDFVNASPYQRFFIVDQPVTYACEGGVLNRYAGYALTSSQATPPAGSSALVSRGLSSCQFRYHPGASQRAGLVTLELSLSEAGETITLLHQVHVVNAP